MFMRPISLMLKLMVLCFLCSCSDDKEPYRMPYDEFTPINIYLAISDEAGNDLLNPENPDNILEDEVYVAFKGQEYHLNKSFDTNPNGEESSITFSGLRVQPLENRYVLVFGGLDGSLYYYNEGLGVQCTKEKDDRHFHLGTEIEIYSVWSYGDDGIPDFYQTYSIVGEEVGKGTPNPVIHLVMHEEFRI